MIIILLFLLKIKTLINKYIFKKDISFWDNYDVPEKNAIDFAHEHINLEPKRCFHTDDDPYTNHYTIEYLLAFFGISINQEIRHNDPYSKANIIANIVNSNNTDTPFIVYRGIAWSTLLEMYKRAKEFPDADLYEIGFVHTSLVRDHELINSCHLRIFVPSGSSCVYLGNVNYEQHYYEVVLQRGAKFKFLSIDNKYINLEYIPEHIYYS